MHAELVERVVEACREHESASDCAPPNRFTKDQIESAVVALSSELERAYTVLGNLHGMMGYDPSKDAAMDAAFKLPHGVERGRAIVAALSNESDDGNARIPQSVKLCR